MNAFVYFAGVRFKRGTKKRKLSTKQYYCKCNDNDCTGGCSFSLEQLKKNITISTIKW